MRKLRVLLVVAGLLTLTAAPAAAYEPVNIVHTERVQAGPYGVTVGFSTWPVRAMQSLDFTFIPDGGIAGKSGTMAWTRPDRDQPSRAQPLARHPRKLDVWGLDIRALEEQGNWDLTFRIEGPAGPGEGTLRDLLVLEQPGPPMALSWSVSVLPLLGLIGFLTVAWRRTSARLRGA
ncbi:hypothetical protein [Amycolatopsis suaedae]|uniref:Uncharacterized protein n=1 Tax=Amycolatopsis suaedae TaxID=2510978 RepID=A0A4Q7JDD4_9PSEU|nr:hypothetical protein [Amycolatopsis suaedae]RZQ64384.1 hypothetical protein EWH70_10505 [Amycolatopsis suaedae]